MSNEITTTNNGSMVPFQEMEKMANVIAKSGLFGIRTADQALALMVIAQAEGLHPGIVARDYHIIQGRPSLKADTMLARFQRSGGTVEWTVYTDTRVAAIWTHPSSPRPLEMDWTIERANGVMMFDKDSNSYKPITAKDNWKNYPRAMLRARLISEAVRTLYPAVSVGIYTPEEIQESTQPPAIEGHYEFVPDTQSEPDPRGAAFTGQPISTDPGVAERQSDLPSQPARIPGGRYNEQGDRLASEAQLESIQKKAKDRGLTRDMLYAQFKINTSMTEELLWSEVTDVFNWIDSHKDPDDSHIKF